MDLDVKSEENELVQQLAARLRRLKESLREFDNCQHVTGHQIHPTIREEIAKIYDEHGGLPILMKITKVGFYTIKKWHRKYKANPTVFREMPLHGRCYRTRGAPESLKNITHSLKEVHECLTQNATYQDAKTPEEMRALLPADILETVDRVKLEMGEGQAPSPDQKLEISRLVIRAGSARPISLLARLTAIGRPHIRSCLRLGKVCLWNQHYVGFAEPLVVEMELFLSVKVRTNVSYRVSFNAFFRKQLQKIENNNQ